MKAISWVFHDFDTARIKEQYDGYVKQIWGSRQVLNVAI